jgi:hypothetical protein
LEFYGPAEPADDSFGRCHETLLSVWCEVGRRVIAAVHTA